MAKTKTIKVAKWIRKGEFSGDEKDSGDIIDSACDLLNGAMATEIIGSNLFLGRDGKYYTVTVEAIIGEASKDYAQEVLAEEADGDEG